MEEEEMQSKEKKVRIATPPKFESIDLNTTPPSPSPTQIVQEEVPNPTFVTPTYMQALSENIHTKFDKDTDLQEFINQLPIIFPFFQQLNTRKLVVDLGPSQQLLAIT